MSGRMITVRPKITDAAPATWESMMPCRHVFSRKNTAAKTAIQARCIKPRTASTAMSGQQDPRHWRPCEIPVRAAAGVPAPKSCDWMKLSGDRHARKQSNLDWRELVYAGEKHDGSAEARQPGGDWRGDRCSEKPDDAKRNQ